MKFIPHLVLALAVLTGTTQAQTVTSSELDGQSEMPGSGADFSYYGNPTNFTADWYYFAGTGFGGQQPTILTDFSEHQGNFQYIDGGQDTNFSSISSPENFFGGPVQTGALFGGNTNPAYNNNNTEFNAVNYTLLNTPGFTYSNFNVYVMYSNNPNMSGFFDTAITLTLVTPTGSTLYVQPVNETNSAFAPGGGTTSVADFAVFNVVGAAPGDTLDIGYVGGNSRYGYVGGVSFAQAPEPSTYAMILAGMAFLGFCLRRKIA